MSNDLKRISRLTAILTQLQTKRLLTAKELAQKFSVSVRTIYRDIRALEQGGVPIITEDGKGYLLMEGYRLPPIMLTESEAYALITAEQLVRNNKDASFVREFTEATAKIKAVLRHSVMKKADLLQERIIIRQNLAQERSSKYLAVLQLALANNQLVKIEYVDERNNSTSRIIEPFALYSEGQKWLLFSYCRLRSDFRAFRLDRIQTLKILDEKFKPQTMSFQEFLQKQYDTPDI